MTKKFLSTISMTRLLLRRIRRDERGAMAIMLAAAMTGIAALGGLITQEAILYQTQKSVQASTNLAALAAVKDIANGSAAATATVNSYTAANPVAGQTVTMASGYPQLLCLNFLKNMGVQCSGPNNANAVKVVQQATVPLIFGGLLGKSTATVAATAIAGYGDANTAGLPYDVMLILDTTASMNTSDTSCAVSGATRVICAEAGARTLLQSFKPSLIHAGLMVFPGVTSTTAALDYDCSASTQPTIVKYSASPQYQIVGLSNDYKTSDTAASLNTSSNLVIALGGGATGCTAGLSAVGGVATYYAGVIAAAQTALTTNGRTGVQKVIIFLSDGDANASASNVPSGMASNQCHEGITAAAAATAAGTMVYTMAYGSPTGVTPSSCSTDTSSPISACQAMQQMASNSSMFFSDTQSGSSGCSAGSANTFSELVSMFSQVSTTFAAPRLVPANAT